MFDVNGDAFLYNSSKNEFKEISLFSPEHFWPPRKGSFLLSEKEKHLNFDNIRIYRVKIGKKLVFGETKTIFRYGFIDDKGYAITHATYDDIFKPFTDGFAQVQLDGHICTIDMQGHPQLDNKPFTKAEFVYYGEQGFTICCTDSKYGLINKYGYLCIPCEYDNIGIIPCESDNICIKPVSPIITSSRQETSMLHYYVKMEKNGLDYIGIIEGDTICNILDFKPTAIRFQENFLIIEKHFIGDDYRSIVKRGLLNHGGCQILKIEYDRIEIVSESFAIQKSGCSATDELELGVLAIVSKNNKEELLLIKEWNYRVLIGDCETIVYGKWFDAGRNEQYIYAKTDKNTIRFFVYKKGDNNNKFANRFVKSYDIKGGDGIYFTYDGRQNNNYFAIVEGDMTKLVDHNGQVIIPLVIPSEYHVKTDTYSEGIVGVYILKKQNNGSDEVIEKPYYSYINSEGKVLTDFEYLGVDKFHKGKAWAHYYSDVSRLIDKDGNIIEESRDYSNIDPIGSNWSSMIDDAFEGDSSAYWNID